MYNNNWKVEGWLNISVIYEKECWDYEYNSKNNDNFISRSLYILN